MTKMFSYLNQHSHQYFQNNFAGSLINKIIDMQHGVIDIFSNIDDIYFTSTRHQCCCHHIAIYSPYLCCDFNRMGALAFLFITFLFLKPIQRLSLDFAESKTSVVGRMVDSIGNIVNVRLFARHSYENQYIASKH